MFILKWRTHMNNIPNTHEMKVKLPVPFENRSTKLPNQLDDYTESIITITRHDLDTKFTSIETPNNAQLNDLDEKLVQIHDFCKQNKYVIVQTDKTKGNKIMKYTDYIKMGEKFINANNDYKKLNKSNKKNIAIEANTLTKQLFEHSNINHSTIKRCIVTHKEVGPAKMFFSIKDHKKADDKGNYPVRPIASVWDTPVAGVDFILQAILAKSSQLVTSYIKDTDDFTNALDSFNYKNNNTNTENYNIVSLDVDSLYPSIPCERAINIILEFIQNNKHNINTFGIPMKLLSEMLEFICFNYETTFNNKIYLQKRGVPMGARFAPPFAIIFMHYIEKIAISNIPRHLRPILFLRYIDDIFMLFLKYLSKQQILQIFNSVDPSVKFTLEEPDNEGWLAFLDTAVKLCEYGILYKWYIKKVHSGNLLRIDSNVPYNTKFNFQSNRFLAVYRRNNNRSFLNIGLHHMTQLLQQNGYDNIQIYKAFLNSLLHQYKNPDEANKFIQDMDDKIPYKTTYNNDTENKNNKKIVENTRLGLKLINKKFMQLKQLGYNPNTQKSCKNKLNCEVCILLKDKFSCKINRVVYLYTCKICKKKYIGKTIVTIRERHNGHKACFNENNAHKSALAQHVKLEHPEIELNIDNFELSILKRVNDIVNLNLTEGLMIDKYKPELNRKFEMTNYIMKL